MSTPVILPIGTEPTTPDFIVQSQPPKIKFLKAGVQPPSQVYVESTDVLTVGVATSQTAEMLTVSYRLLRFDGVLVHGQFTINPPSTRAVTVHAEQLAEGFLLSLSMKAAVAATRGQTFARAFLTKPALGAGQPSYMLMSDYVTTAMAPGFPNGRVLAPSEGPGLTASYVIPAPSPGSGWFLVVPANTRWRLRSYQNALTTVPGGGDRIEQIQISVSGRVVFIGSALATQAGGNEMLYCGAVSTLYTPANTTLIIVPIPPDLVLLAGDFIADTAINLEPADQWSAGSLAVEEWLDNV